MDWIRLERAGVFAAVVEDDDVRLTDDSLSSDGVATATGLVAPPRYDKQRALSHDNFSLN